MLEDHQKKNKIKKKSTQERKKVQGKTYKYSENGDWWGYNKKPQEAL